MSKEQVIMLPKAFVHAECVMAGAMGEVRLSGTKEGFALLRDHLNDFLENEVVPGTHAGFVAEGMIPWTFKCIARERQVPFRVDALQIERLAEHQIKNTLVEPVCDLCNGTGQLQPFHDGPMEICICREVPPDAQAVMTPEMLDEMCDKFFDGMAFKAPSIESLLYELDRMARLYRNTNKNGCHNEQLAAIAKQRSELIDKYNEAVASSPSPKEEEPHHE